MAYPGIKKTQGFDFNFFQKVTVNWTTHFGASDGYTTADGYGPDLIIRFPTQGLIFNNEGSGGIIEYSFNGNTIHGELTASGNRQTIIFNNRVASLIWFRAQSGSAVVSVEAWGTR